MFDFFKLSAPAKYSEQLLNNKSLNFDFRINSDSVIITEHGYSPKRAKINGFDIIVWEHPIKPHRIYIKGSFHKLHEGETNYKNFYFYEFITAVNSLCDSINIPPSELCIHLFEIGVNITSPIETNLLIEGIKSFSGKKFERETYNNKGLLLRFDFAQYQIKIYDKGFQFAQPEPILRFELKIKKMSYIKTKGANITTLQDIISGEWNTYFGNLLLTQWDKVILCPEGMINPNLITNPRTRENFINGLNADYWTGLNSKAYKRQFARFKDMFKQFAPIDLYSVIHNLIKEKWEHLSKEQRGKYYPYVYGNINPFSTNHPEKKFCVSCGRDISIQRNNSRFCSELLFGKDVKKCRNQDSNPRNNRKRKELRLYPSLTLFPVYIHCGYI